MARARRYLGWIAIVLASLALVVTAFLVQSIRDYSRAIEGDDSYEAHRVEAFSGFARADFWRARRSVVIQQAAASGTLGVALAAFGILTLRAQRNARE